MTYVPLRPEVLLFFFLMYHATIPIRLSNKKPRTKPIAIVPPVPRPPLPEVFDFPGALVLVSLVAGLPEDGAGT